MTLLTQEIRTARGPAYWRAWIDSPASVAGDGRTQAEAIGKLVMLIAELNPGPVQVVTRPPAGDPPAKVVSGRAVVLSAKGGGR